MGNKVFSFLFVFLLLSASAVSLDSFQPVHRARAVREGANVVHLDLSSAEWCSGLEWKPSPAADFSGAKYLAVDVENLSKTRQARLTMHLSAGADIATNCPSLVRVVLGGAAGWTLGARAFQTPNITNVVFRSVAPTFGTADGELVFGTGETETLSMNFNVKARRRGAWASIVATARA